MTLVEFLTARWDDAEQVARQRVADNDLFDSQRDPTRVDLVYIAPLSRPGNPGDPAHVLADITAKRWILALHCVRDGTGRSGDRYAATCDECGGRHPCDTVRALAEPFADHPDYDAESWRP
jgi:hypothetical protein